MRAMTSHMMRDLCQLSLHDELEEFTKFDLKSIKYEPLSSGQVEQLARKIALLPSAHRNILLFRYCFKSTPDEIDQMLESENTVSKLPYVQKMLSSFMGLENSWIDNDSMERACQIVLIEVTKSYEETEILHKPTYSKNFRRKLKDIKIKQSYKGILMLLAKRVAVFILVCILSISAALVVNIEAREKVFTWVVETFSSFTIFTPQNINDGNDLVKLIDLKINYIPQGFELMDIHQGQKMLIYDYLSEDNQALTIKFVDPSGEGKSYYDTENAEVKEIMFKDSKAYTWEMDALTYFIWYQNGVECHISGNLNQAEIIRVAENVSKQI